MIFLNKVFVNQKACLPGLGVDAFSIAESFATVLGIGQCETVLGGTATNTEPDGSFKYTTTGIVVTNTATLH